MDIIMQNVPEEDKVNKLFLDFFYIILYPRMTRS